MTVTRRPPRVAEGPGQVSSIDPFYRDFEDRFRGTRAEIQERLRVYLPYVRPFLSGDEQPRALDLGCGRGEWLELLTGVGCAARGVDLDEGMLAACTAAGLDAARDDALSALRASPDDSLSIVSAFHLVEHVPFTVVQELATEALRALRPGGLLVLETPNPENLVVGTSTFYLDPTHDRPLPPHLLQFLVDRAGFGRSQVLRLQERAGLAGREQVVLLDVLNGVSPDYAVVAQKGGDDDLTAAVDEAFTTPRGLTLEQLAEAFTQTAAAQVARAVAAADAVAARLEDEVAQRQELAAQVARSSADVEGLRDRLSRAEDSLAALEAQRQAALARLAEVEASTSWRVTAPLRSVAESLRDRRRQGGPESTSS